MKIKTVLTLIALTLVACGGVPERPARLAKPAAEKAPSALDLVDQEMVDACTERHSGDDAAFNACVIRKVAAKKKATASATPTAPVGGAMMPGMLGLAAGNSPALGGIPLLAPKMFARRGLNGACETHRTFVFHAAENLHFVVRGANRAQDLIPCVDNDNDYGVTVMPVADAPIGFGGNVTTSTVGMIPANGAGWYENPFTAGKNEDGWTMNVRIQAYSRDAVPQKVVDCISRDIKSPNFSRNIIHVFLENDFRSQGGVCFGYHFG